MTAVSTKDRITLYLQDGRVRTKIGDAILADTSCAIELHESDYQPRLYLPREDVRMELLARSDTVTHCPFKGDATYFSYAENTDVAWSYEQPLTGMQALAQYIAFDDKKVNITKG